MPPAAAAVVVPLPERLRRLLPELGLELRLVELLNCRLRRATFDIGTSSFSSVPRAALPAGPPKEGAGDEVLLVGDDSFVGDDNLVGDDGFVGDAALLIGEDGLEELKPLDGAAGADVWVIVSAAAATGAATTAAAAAIAWPALARGESATSSLGVS